MPDRGTDRILVVEDDRAVTRVVSAALRNRGYSVQSVTTGEAALVAAEKEGPDVVVLDLGLPDIDGVDVCRRLRAWSTVPIIVVTAEGAHERKVLALDQGADDYVTKPFSTAELLARIRVALRHRQDVAAPEDDAVLRVGDLQVDLARHAVEVGARKVDVTPKEFAFLALLARWPGRVLTHRTILQEVWGPEYGSESQYLRVYASQLRKKLDDDPAQPRLITEPGVGYRLVDPAAEAGGS